MVYYLGGKIAEDGVNKEDNELIAEAKKLLKKNTTEKIKQKNLCRKKQAEKNKLEKNFQVVSKLQAKSWKKGVLCLPFEFASLSD